MSISLVGAVKQIFANYGSKCPGRIDAYNHLCELLTLAVPSATPGCKVVVDSQKEVVNGYGLDVTPTCLTLYVNFDSGKRTTLVEFMCDGRNVFNTEPAIACGVVTRKYPERLRNE